MEIVSSAPHREIMSLRLDSICDQHIRENINASISLGNIVVVEVNTDGFIQFESIFSTMLSNDEIDFVSRLELKTVKTRHIIHRGILRWLVAQITNRAPHEIDFYRGQNGKPFLKNDLDLFFNISHSSSWALYAFVLGASVGVDIEEGQRNLSLNRLAPLFFSSQELDTFRPLNHEEQHHAFFHLWTMKEAVTKCLGMGLSMDFTQINFGVSVASSSMETKIYQNILVNDISKESTYYASIAVGASMRVHAASHYSAKSLSSRVTDMS